MYTYVYSYVLMYNIYIYTICPSIVKNKMFIYPNLPYIQTFRPQCFESVPRHQEQAMHRLARQLRNPDVRLSHKQLLRCHLAHGDAEMRSIHQILTDLDVSDVRSAPHQL